MKYLEPRISYKNFEPKNKVKQIVLSRIGRIKRLSPCGAFIDFMVDRTEEGYSGSLKVVSPTGTFASKRSDDSFTCLISNIEKEVKSQIDTWKKNRFKSFSKVS